MNYYQITYNNLQGFDVNLIHKVISEDKTILDWWHYLPNVYLVKSNNSASAITDKIRAVFPRMSFLIVKVDLKDFGGYLKREAWDWIRKQNNLNLTYKNPTSLPPIGSTEDPISKALEILARNKIK